MQDHGDPFLFCFPKRQKPFRLSGGERERSCRADTLARGGGEVTAVILYLSANAAMLMAGMSLKGKQP